MKRITLTLLCSFFALLSLALPACAAEVKFSAASSLKEVMNEIVDRFAATHPGITFIKSYGGSGTLAKQIENGAPADIFISANVEWMEFLKQKRLVEQGGPGAFAFNALVFAGGAGNRVSGMQDLDGLKRIAIGSPKSVPAGEYAMDAIRKAGMEKRLAGRLVMARDVREGMMYAERGEVDGAFVYRTDALQAKRIKILFAVPKDLYPQIVYPMAMTQSGSKNREAGAFFRYLQGSEAKSVLNRYGFMTK